MAPPFEHILLQKINKTKPDIKWRRNICSNCVFNKLWIFGEKNRKLALQKKKIARSDNNKGHYLPSMSQHSTEGTKIVLSIAIDKLNVY